MLLALEELQQDGVTFNIQWARAPFFLRGEQRNIDAMLAELGLPRDASRAEVAEKRGNGRGARIDALFAQAGLDDGLQAARDRGQYSDTMDSHRLAWYAATEGKGEAVWDATSRKYFQAKTSVQAIRLDDRALLSEVIAEAGLDPAEANKVLDDRDAYRAEIQDAVRQMHEQGVSSIPVLIFSFGRAQQIVHHGSGNKEEFKRILCDVRRGAQGYGSTVSPP